MDTDTELNTRHGLQVNQKGREQTTLKITNEVKDTTWSPSGISSGAPFVCLFVCCCCYYCIIIIIIIIIIIDDLPLNIQDAKLVDSS